jgi:cytochrome c-type biogenesis protein CcmH/NrfG
MKRSPFIAITLAITLALFIYVSSSKQKVISQPKQTITVSDQINEAFTNIRNGDSPEAQMMGILKMRSLAEEYPENSDLQWNMGLFSMQSGQFEKALDRFKNVLKIDSSRQDATMQLALCYTSLEDTINAQKVLQSLLIKSEGDLRKNVLIMLEKLK